MSTPYLGQITPFAFNYAPRGWALCNGQLLPINQNQALFSLLGTFYGGNGITDFALPNLQGSVSMSFGTFPGDGTEFVVGQAGGELSHTLVTTELPSHTHNIAADSAAPSSLPTANYPGLLAGAYATSASAAPVNLGGGSSSTGSGQPHENRPPFLVINFCIALTGIFPSRN